MRRGLWLLFASVFFGLGSFGSVVYAVQGYKDSNLPCGQVSGPVLCNVDFPDGNLSVTAKIPIDAYSRFPKTASNLISDFMQNSFGGGTAKYFANFNGAVLYGQLRDAVANTCLGGSVITQPHVEHFYGRGLTLVNDICSRFPSCERFWADRTKDLPEGAFAADDTVDKGDPAVYGARVPASAFPSINIPACAPLASGINLTAPDTSIPDGGEYAISWSSGGNPGVTCTLEGRMPNNFSAQSTSGSHTFFNVPTGVYTHDFTCTGVLDGDVSAKIGSIVKTKIVKVGDIAPTPTVLLNSSASTIKKGEKVTLTWKTDNAETVTIDQGIGSVAQSGSVQVSPEFTTRYTLEAIGKYSEIYGKTRKGITIRVTTPTFQPSVTPPPEETPAPTETPETFTPPQKSIPQADLKVNGDNTAITLAAPATFTLSWESGKPTCLGYGKNWIGIKGASGSEVVTVTSPGNYNYNLYCPGFPPVGDLVTVKVVGGVAPDIFSQTPTAIGTPLPVAEAGISTDGIHYNRSIRVVRGKPVKLWLSASQDVTGDRRASRDENNSWNLIQNGGRCLINYDLNFGTPTFEAVAESPTTSSTCDLELGERVFNDAPGVYRYGALRLVQVDGKTSNVGYINIAVLNPPPPKGVPVVNLNVGGESGNVVLGVPASYTLAWDVVDADTCTASGAWSGDKSMQGSQNFVGSIKKTFVYTLTCKGKLGTTVSTLNLKLAEVPNCVFTARPEILDKRSVFIRQSELSWKCSLADHCSIAPTTGANINTFGSVRVSPSVSTTYRLNCNNQEAEKSFNVSIEVR